MTDQNPSVHLRYASEIAHTLPSSDLAVAVRDLLQAVAHDIESDAPSSTRLWLQGIRWANRIVYGEFQLPDIRQLYVDHLRSDGWRKTGNKNVQCQAPTCESKAMYARGTERLCKRHAFASVADRVHIRAVKAGSQPDRVATTCACGWVYSVESSVEEGARAWTDHAT